VRGDDGLEVEKMEMKDQAPRKKRHRTIGTELRMLVSAGVSIAIVLALTACGGDDDGDRPAAADAVPDAFAAPTAPPDDAREGGELTVLVADDVDYMDPGATWSQLTYMVTSATHRTLLAWQPDDEEAPSPDLAAEEPDISDDGQTVTFTLREGVRFSPPVDREVTSADVKYAIERGLLPGVANGYVWSYLADLVGFDDAAEQAEGDPTGGAPEIAGITTPDDRTLVLELERPTALAAVQALSLPLSAPVPEEYAGEHDARNPSTYGSHVVFTGPYMVENDSSGELTGYEPGRSISLVRNPSWDPESDWRPAYLDSIEIDAGFSDAGSASRQILAGAGLVNGGITPPPGVIRGAVEEGEEGQLVASPSGGNRYVALNTSAQPFDDVDVRRAVLAAADRTALRNARGGELNGPVASHLLPPGFPGFDEAGGFEGPELDFLENPDGNPELAADYMRQAGHESGSCEGDCSVTVVADGDSPGREVAEVFIGTLEDLGFDVDARYVSFNVMITRFCGSTGQAPHACPNLGWLKDFNDGQSMLQPTFSGDAIQPQNNANVSQLDVPEINAAIDDAVLTADPDERARAWGEIDAMIMEQAAAVPYSWDNEIHIRSSDVAGVVNLFNANWDLAHTSLE
jgi:peptide/nickel transport system substrate-binding protein